LPLRFFSDYRKALSTSSQVCRILCSFIFARETREWFAKGKNDKSLYTAVGNDFALNGFAKILSFPLRGLSDLLFALPNRGIGKPEVFRKCFSYPRKEAQRQ